MHANESSPGTFVVIYTHTHTHKINRCKSAQYYIYTMCVLIDIFQRMLASVVLICVRTGWPTSRSRPCQQRHVRRQRCRAAPGLLGCHRPEHRAAPADPPRWGAERRPPPGRLPPARPPPPRSRSAAGPAAARSCPRGGAAGPAPAARRGARRGTGRAKAAARMPEPGAVRRSHLAGPGVRRQRAPSCSGGAAPPSPATRACSWQRCRRGSVPGCLPRR